MKNFSLLIFALLFSTGVAFSQATTKFKDTGSISNQVDNIMKYSNRYEDYKVVKIDWLLKLKNNINDSISVYKNEINGANTIFNAQKKSIDSLKLALNTSEKSITNLSNEIQSISLFGIQMNKSAFKTAMFSTIAILALLLIFFITKFKNSHSVTSQAKQDLKELDEEFEAHRKKALEREQKVRRQLQDELNKQKKDK